MAHGRGGAEDGAPPGLSAQRQIAVLQAKLARETLDGAPGGLIPSARGGVPVLEMTIGRRIRLKEDALERHARNRLEETAFARRLTSQRDGGPAADPRGVLAEVEELLVLPVESGGIDDLGGSGIGQAGRHAGIRARNGCEGQLESARGRKSDRAGGGRQPEILPGRLHP